MLLLKALSPPPPPSLRIKRTRSTVLQRAISGINGGLHKSKAGHRRATKTSFHDGDDDDDAGHDDAGDDASGCNDDDADEYEYD